MRGLWVGLMLMTGIAQAAVPAYLPRYELAIDLNTNTKMVNIRERITWTNAADRDTQELVVNFYPRYTVPKSDELMLAKTLEVLRLNPSDAMLTGTTPPGKINTITMTDPAGRVIELPYEYGKTNPTAVSIALPNVVRPGESVTVTVDCSIRLPNKQGRWGHWKGVHVLANSLPTVAYYDHLGWHAMPFVPWHQPFWNEAGIYTGTIKLPKEQKLACSAAIGSVDEEDGKQVSTILPFTGRDFTLVCSAEFREYTHTAKTDSGQEIQLKCLAFERHEFRAKIILDTVAQAIPRFARWFGDFPSGQYTIVESYFGWNGNESAGLTMIDERVFDMPKAGIGYIEYLVSHETCHQWWYNLVGTNGYSETFMDEGAATFFTHKMLNAARGKNNTIIAWDDIPFTPSVRRENYRFSSMMGAIGRDEMKPAIGSLPEFGHLFNLFTGAYDRGSKVFGLMEARMGEANFHDFIRDLVGKYSWKVLSAAKLETELNDYTGKSWKPFFDDWVYGRGLTDWSVERVEVDDRRLRRIGPWRKELPRSNNGYPVTVILRQSREYDEPTTLAFRQEGQPGFPIRIPILGTKQETKLDDFNTTVTPLGDGRVRVSLTLPQPPDDIIIDPDHVLLDADPANNSWTFAPNAKLIPLMSMVDENDLTNDYTRWNFVAGLWSGGSLYYDPWYTRGLTFGAKASAIRTQKALLSAYTGYRWDFNDIVLGVDGLIDHVPFPMSQIGFNYERRIAQLGGNQGQNGANRASLFGRYIFQQGPSLYLPPISYADLYTTYQDNFLPDARVRATGAVRPTSTWLSGAHYRLNLFTPYWDPEKGIFADLVYSAGTARLDGETVGAQQFRAEVAAVRKLPEGLGYFSDVRIAARGLYGGAWPLRGEFYTLGGSSQFRGFDLREQQGSQFWLANVEARFPVLRDRSWNFVDNLVGVRDVWLAGFYDVGRMYANERAVGDTAHALGMGLRVNVALMSFIENAVLRVDVAKTLNASTPFQFWIGVQHPF
jgi:hypothetical protein